MATKQKARKKVENKMAEEQQDSQVDEEIQEDIVEEIPMGDDPSVLFASQEEKSLEILHAGKKWIFV